MGKVLMIHGVDASNFGMGKVILPGSLEEISYTVSKESCIFVKYNYDTPSMELIDHSDTFVFDVSNYVGMPIELHSTAIVVPTYYSDSRLYYRIGFTGDINLPSTIHDLQYQRNIAPVIEYVPGELTDLRRDLSVSRYLTVPAGAKYLFCSQTKEYLSDLHCYAPAL